MYDRGDFGDEGRFPFTVSSDATFQFTQSPSAAPTDSNLPTISSAPTTSPVKVIVSITFAR